MIRRLLPWVPTGIAIALASQWGSSLSFFIILVLGFLAGRLWPRTCPHIGTP